MNLSLIFQKTFVDACLLCRQLSWSKLTFCNSCLELLERRPLLYRHVAGLDIFSLLHYAPPSDQLMKLSKEAQSPEVSQALSSMATRKLSRECLWPPQAVVPMPARKQGAKDHAYLIAEEAARFLRVPLCNEFLKRAGDSFQKKKSQSERQRAMIENTAVPFSEAGLSGPILLVDDVVTTGATLVEAWKKLGRPPALGLTLSSTPLLRL